MKKIIVLCLLLLCFQWSQAQKTNNHKWDFISVPLKWDELNN